ncbi:MAG TPA: DUF3040 domain-containing protein [Propioniciclava sp.]|uniref:DUF3040 domain-containing protein n=1 Tax=Propioniciclava sp. TaxID=2038686 RepID=UPI002BBFEE04|nr:DUF3040 domain-containing protein [Propioniciclava sp.]HRL48800.1 DUF3040 domain-containing protein [Propioniciclava sp.]HRL78819.1 DUF3040 domain-containing protein [Propioniciclava sp.]
MALSEHEQRLLEQLEAALAADDPKLANTLRGSRSRSLHRRHAALAGVGFVVGLVALVAGMQVTWVISVIGFVVMLASTVLAISAWRHVDAGAQPAAGTPHSAPTERDTRRRPEDRF